MEKEEYTQVYNPKTKRYVARDKDTGKFVNVNEAENQKFEGIEEEK